MSIIQIGNVGFFEAYLLSVSNREALAKRFPERLLLRLEKEWKDFESRRDDIVDTLVSLGFNNDSCEEGRYFLELKNGLFAGLWNMGESLNTGLGVDLRRVPISQEIVEISEFLDLNPFKIKSGGSFVLAEKGDGKGIIETLEEKLSGIPVSVIGSLRSDNDRVFYYDENRGYLTPGE